MVWFMAARGGEGGGGDTVLELVLFVSQVCSSTCFEKLQRSIKTMFHNKPAETICEYTLTTNPPCLGTKSNIYTYEGRKKKNIELGEAERWSICHDQKRAEE